MNENINKTTIYNFISTFIIQGLAFFTTPIFSRMLGTTQYGKYYVIYSWIIVLSGVLDLGINSSLGVGVHSFKDDFQQFKCNVIKITAILSAIFFVVISFGLIVVHVDKKTYLLFLLIWGLSYCKITANDIQYSLIYEKKPKINLFFSVTLGFSVTLLSLSLVFFGDKKILYLMRLFGEFAPYLLMTMVFVLYQIIRYKAPLKKEYASFALKIGLPIVFHELSRNILTQSDRIMMKRMNIDESYIGIYSLFISLAFTLNIILTAFNNAWCPFYYDDLDEGNYDYIRKKTRNYVELFSVLCIGFLLLSREVSYLMADSSYSSGTNLIPVFVISIYFIFMYLFPVNFEFYHKKTVLIAIGSVLAALVNIILNYFMINKYGSYGAAYATCISYFFLFVFHFFSVKKIMKEEYCNRIIEYIPGIFLLLIGTFCFYYLSGFWYIRWGLGLVIGIIELKRIINRKTIF